MYSSIKPSLQFSCNFVEINASEGSHFVQMFILYNSWCQVLCDSCKKLYCTTTQCCFILFCSYFGIIDCDTCKCCKLGTAQADARGIRDVALLIISCTDSIKPSLQCSCNFIVIITLYSHFNIYPSSTMWQVQDQVAQSVTTYFEMLPYYDEWFCQD
jgi:hypothetical protein